MLETLSIAPGPVPMEMKVKFKSVKKNSEVVLTGIKVELDIVNDTVKAVVFTDGNGNTVRVVERTYSLYVEIPAPPETEKKYKLSGHVLDLPIEKIYDDRFDADQAMSRLQSEAARSDLKVEEVQVAVEA